MTCKDCVHSPICKVYADFGVTDIPYDENDTCEMFKNKNNFVEAVRCKDCKRFLADTDYCRETNQSYCELDNIIKQRTHYCGYGERRSDR